MNTSNILGFPGWEFYLDMEILGIYLKFFESVSEPAES